MNVAILLLAGKSDRLKQKTKKQFALINNKPLFTYAFSNFVKTNKFEKYVFVVSKEDKDYVKNIVSSCPYDISIVEGGKTRQESAYKGLLSLKGVINDDDNVLIHDAARPIVDQKLICNILEGLNQFKAVIPVINICDSIIKTKNDCYIDCYKNRDEYKLVQTPQGFKYKSILDAHEAFKNEQVTDDASLILKMNHEVKVIKGNKLNFKVTTADDLELIKQILEAN